MKWYPSDPSGQCVRHNGAGMPFEEFTCLYPTLGKTYLSYERSFDPVPARDYMLERPMLCILGLALYFAFIVLVQQYFKRREAWNWRRALAVWNFSLSLFSAIGFVRTFPALLHNYVNYSVRENFCMDPESSVGSGSTGLWTLLFVLSKFPELIDTVFIVVHKKPLIFLHWYHHVSVLAFCWYGYLQNPPTGIIFATMNYGVHAVMYFYYFLMAVHCKPKWFKPVWITVGQISQMVVGCVVTAFGLYLLFVEKPEGCNLTKQNICPSLVMYGSYLVLFVQFFFRRYAFRATKNKKLS